MSQYRKKPVVIEAVQFHDTPEGRGLVLQFTGLSASNAAAIYFRSNSDKGEIVIRTLEGDLVASDGDWIIRGIKGEFYPCKPDIFEAIYEPV